MAALLRQFPAQISTGFEPALHEATQIRNTIGLFLTHSATVVDYLFSGERRSLVWLPETM